MHKKTQCCPTWASWWQVKDLANEIKLFRVALLNGGSEAFRDYKPGQFAFLSAWGVGEAPFGIASVPQRGQTLDFAVNRLGAVTNELHELGPGDLVGVRGPLGNWFPMEKFKGKNLIVIGGGIGGAPLRPVIQTVLDQRADYGHLTILWAARHPSLLVFTDEYEEWRQTPATDLYLTVDQPDERWTYNIGLITDLLARVAPFAGQCGEHHLRPAGHDPFCQQDAGRAAWLLPGSKLCHPGSAHALRHRQVRALQPGRQADLCGWAGIYHGRSRRLTGEASCKPAGTGSGIQNGFQRRSPWVQSHVTFLLLIARNAWRSNPSVCRYDLPMSGSRISTRPSCAWMRNGRASRPPAASTAPTRRRARRPARQAMTSPMPCG